MKIYINSAIFCVLLSIAFWGCKKEKYGELVVKMTMLPAIIYR